jgi:hypothetical protein
MSSVTENEAVSTTEAPVDGTTDTASEGTPQVPETPAKDKAEIYARVASLLNGKVEQRFSPVKDRVRNKFKEEINMRRVFGDEDSRLLLVLYFNQLLALLTKPGPNGKIVKGTTVGLPGGLGSLEILTAGATKKKTPQGKTIDVEERWRLKWNPGKNVDLLLEKLPKPDPDPEPATDPNAGGDTGTTEPVSTEPAAPTVSSPV